MLLAAFLAVIWSFGFGPLVTAGRDVRAEVVRVGMIPAGPVAGGNLPIIIVRLPDGSVREVRATWPDVKACRSGSWISLVQQGTALQVGRPGCENGR